jgi:hypothetical protein
MVQGALGTFTGTVVSEISKLKTVLMRCRNKSHQPPQPVFNHSQPLWVTLLVDYSEQIADFGTDPTELSSLLGRSSSIFQVQKRHSTAIASVCRKRLRLPSSLIIENASAVYFSLPGDLAPRRFRSRLATNRTEPGTEPGKSEQQTPGKRPGEPLREWWDCHHDSGRLSFRINPAQRGVQRSSLPYHSRRYGAP